MVCQPLPFKPSINIYNCSEISKLKNAGANLIVLGNILEELPSSEEINKLLLAAS